MFGVKRLFQVDFTAAAGHRKMPTAYTANRIAIAENRRVDSHHRKHREIAVLIGICACLVSLAALG